jgi:hypothetical protein
MSYYRNMTQTCILFILTVSTTSIFEKLIDINYCLSRIENKMETQKNFNNKNE